MERSTKKYFSDKLQMSVARSVEEIERIRPIWEQLQRDEPYPIINADIDRFLSVIKASNDNVQPYVVLVKKEDHPIAMVIGLLEKRSIKLRVGYKAIFRPKLRCLTVVHGGILGQPTKDICSLLIGELMDKLREREVDMVYLSHVRTDSVFYQLARKMPGVLSRGYFPRIEPHWRMSIPPEIDTFYKTRSPKHRKHLKQYIKKLEKAYPGQVKMITYSKPSELDEAIEMAFQISRNTYQYAIGSGFTDDFRKRTLMLTAAKLNWFRTYVLCVGDEPCAFRSVLHYGRTYFADGIGFDPRWGKFRVGTVLFLKVLESLCQDPNVDYYDFGFGDAEYKRSYGTEKWNDASLQIFAPRFYPIVVNMSRSVMLAMMAGFEYVLNKAGAVSWVKRRWRNSLQKDVVS